MQVLQVILACLYGTCQLDLQIAMCHIRHAGASSVEARWLGPLLLVFAFVCILSVQDSLTCLLSSADVAMIRTTFGSNGAACHPIEIT